MHISKLSLINYRNFANAKLLFRRGVNTIIGENGAGKTNVFRAIRLMLDQNLSRSASRLAATDFHRGLPDWRGHWIIVSLEFQELSPEESIQSLFLHGAAVVAGDKLKNATYNLIFRPKAEIRVRLAALADGDTDGLRTLQQSIALSDYETLFTGRSEADFNDPAIYHALVGDFENVRFNKELDPPGIGAKVPQSFSITDDISFTFVQALRDVVAEFQNSRTNPLLTLLKSKSGNIDPAAFAPIATMARDLNVAIEGLTDVKTLRSDILSTIKGAAGETYSPSALSIRSELSDEADKLFQALKLFVGESDAAYQGGVHELSLGGANLIYLTLKLLEFKYQRTKESFANFLLIEEPEAHIHTHIQKTLFDKLNFDDTQIIYSTHSTQISEVSNVENINILSRAGGTCEAYQPSAGLPPSVIGGLQRYLDAIRSNLLFAKSVVLVEGDAEEILIPVLARKVLGLSLDELGISLINIRSTGFENVAVLFHDARIRKRCAVVTDLDAAIMDTTPAVGDSEASAKYKAKLKGSADTGVARKAALETFSAGNQWLSLAFAPHTFEVDFVGSGNAPYVVSTLPEVYKTPAKIAEAKAELEAHTVADYGRRVLTIATQEGKGWFAILLSKQIDHKAVIPPYVVDAIIFAHGPVSANIIANILEYRVNRIEGEGVFGADVIAPFREELRQFNSGALDFHAIRNRMLSLFPADQINAILARL